MPNVQFQAVDQANNAPLPGATISVYLDGTTSFANLFTTQGGAASNPLTADSNGLVVFQIGAGTYRLVVQSGVYVGETRLIAADTPYGLQNFGAVGDGASHPASTRFSSLAACQAVYPFASDLSQEMDWLAWQSALDAGGLVESQPQHYVMCNANVASQQPLTVVAGRSWVEANGSTWDFSAMVAQASSQNFVANHNFATATGWANATGYAAGTITPASFTTGAAVYTDPSVGSSTGHFCQFGIQISLSPGRYRALATISATLGQSYAQGYQQPPFAGIGLFVTSPGFGQYGGSVNMSGLNPALVQGQTVTETIFFDFELTTPTTVWPTFSGSGYANYRITDFGVVSFFPNCALLLTRDGAADHYNIRQPVTGVKLLGPGGTNGVAGILYKSFNNTDGNLVDVESCSISGFGTAVAFEDGAYLTEFRNVEIFGNATGLSFPGGAVNAGENLRFYGGGIFNNAVGVDNPGGAELSFFGTAIDYNTQAITRNASRIELHGVHAEMNMPLTTGLPLFECISGGHIKFYGGMFLGAGAVNTAAEPPIKVAGPTDCVEFYGTQIYNLSSAAGVAATGQGTIRAPGGWLNTGNPNILFLSASPAMDALNGAGQFEPASPQIHGLDASGIDLVGGMYPDPGVTVSDRWTNGAMTATISTDHAHSGTRSLKFTKAQSLSVNSEIQILAPVDVTGQEAWIKFHFLSPNNITVISGNIPSLYVRLFWVRLLGYDQYARPIIAGAQQFAGEDDIIVPLTGSPNWVAWGYTTAINLAGQFPAGRPSWATHISLVLDTEALPAMSFYIDDLAIAVM